MTFSAVGSFVQTTTTTLAVNPAKVGNFYLAEVIAYSNTVYCSSISGGNCTWTQLGSKYVGSNHPDYATVFIGKATATGAANATLTFSGATPSFNAVAQQFSSSAGSWVQDGLQGTEDLATGSATWPSLTPNGPGGLYFGYLYDTGTAVGGSTPGYTYDVDAGGNGLAFNLSCGNGAQAPVWGDAGSAFGVVILLKETPSSSQAGVIRARLPQYPVLRGRSSSNPGAPLNNPNPGPVFRPATSPARIRITLPPRGRISFSRRGTVSNPNPGPVFLQAAHPIRAVIPQVFSKGRTGSDPGAPVNNPSPGPVFRQKTYPARIRTTLPPRGRVGSNKGVGPFIPNPGPVLHPFDFPARARIPQNAPRGRVTSNSGTIPPLLLINTFEGGTNTTTISTGNSGGASGNAFTSINGTPAFSTTTAASGTVSGEFQSGTGATEQGVTWTVYNQSVIYASCYVNFAALPGAGLFERIILLSNSQGTQLSTLRIGNNGLLLVENTSSTVLYTFSNAIVLNTWYRIETSWSFTGAQNAGRATVRLFSPDNSQIPIEQVTTAADQNFGGSPCASVGFGFFSNHPNEIAYFDNLNVNNTGFPGPRSLTGPASLGHPVCAVTRPLPLRGHTGSNYGTPPNNPTPGPAFYPATSPIRARIPQTYSKGRGYSGNPGGPYAILPRTYQYVGHVPAYYLDYEDGYADTTLYAIPGENYWIVIANTRAGLAVPPADGNWIDPDADPIVDEIPLHRKVFLKLRKHIHKSRRRSGYRNQIEKPEKPAVFNIPAEIPAPPVAEVLDAPLQQESNFLSSVPGIFIPGGALPGEVASGGFTSGIWLFGGDVPLWYQDYLNQGTEGTLLAFPGGTYRIMIGNSDRAGLVIPPAVGYWIEE